MTNHEIVEMAKEAGFSSGSAWNWIVHLQKFSELVAKQAISDALVSVSFEVAQEREACAKVCEEEICACCWDDDAQAAAEHLADTIRKRSNV